MTKGVYLCLFDMLAHVSRDRNHTCGVCSEVSRYLELVVTRWRNLALGRLAILHLMPPASRHLFLSCAHHIAPHPTSTALPRAEVTRRLGTTTSNAVLRLHTTTSQLLPASFPCIVRSATVSSRSTSLTFNAALSYLLSLLPFSLPAMASFRLGSSTHSTSVLVAQPEPVSSLSISAP